MTLSTKTEGVRPLAYILREVDDILCREIVTIKSGAGKLKAGTVLGQLTTGGKWLTSPNAVVTGSEGAEAAKGILAYPVDATDSDVQAVITRRLTAVKKPMLIFDASVNDATKIATKWGQLEAHNIIAR